MNDRTDIDLGPLRTLTRRWARTKGHAGDEATFTAMPGGASTRRYFRVRIEGGDSAVAMFVPDASKADEIDKSGARTRWPFLEVHELLRQRNIDVPALFGEDCASGFLILEDLGDDTLANYLTKHEASRTSLYTRAVTDLAKAQRNLATLDPHSIVACRAFDEDLLRLEIDHFREWGIEARGLALRPADRAAFDGIAERLARRIASWPRGFTHRDYQSRNLMVRPAETLVWIDFQDALLGPRVYDLVALLNDSYQEFDRAFVEARIHDFADEARLGDTERRELLREFDLVTVQRKLKDAGRFVYVDRVKNNPSFLGYVEPTIKKARAAMARLADSDPDMAALGALLDRVLVGPS
ncbi:MAG: phosphotransferase [Polyangiaceae bacterium]